MRTNQKVGWGVVAAIGVIVGALGLLVRYQGERGATGTRAEGADAQPKAPEVAASATTMGDCDTASCSDVWPVPASYVAVGGGAFPENTEVSLEQDLALLTEVLDRAGPLYFGGGPGARSVRELRVAPLTPQQQLSQELGQLFAPRNGRDSIYRASHLRAAAATLVRVEQRLEAEFEVSGAPLLLYIATHGEPGDEPGAVAVTLWGGQLLTPRELAALHDGTARPLRLVVTSCYSGAFAELAFNDADSDAGATVADRCGLFAGTWDRETSGCDPDPERRHQESYALHMLHALRGHDRHGQPLQATDIDADGNGHISLLEAHSFARGSARSIDVPTSTSERFLREAQTEQATIDPALLPEEALLTRRLGERLGIATQDEAERALRRLERRVRTLDDGMAAAEQVMDETYFSLASRLLSRFPVLSDAYHPEFAGTIQAHGTAIASLLHSSKEANAYEQARTAVAEFDAELARAQVDEAELLRLSRSLQTQGLAAALAARGGADYEDYQRLLACERFEPPQPPAPPPP